MTKIQVNFLSTKPANQGEFLIKIEWNKNEVCHTHTLGNDITESGIYTYTITDGLGTCGVLDLTGIGPNSFGIRQNKLRGINGFKLIFNDDTEVTCDIDSEIPWANNDWAWCDKGEHKSTKLDTFKNLIFTKKIIN